MATPARKGNGSSVPFSDRDKFNFYPKRDLGDAIREACARSNQTVTDLLEPFIRLHLDEILAIKKPRNLKLRPGRRLRA